jgi:hypothetical protein
MAKEMSVISKLACSLGRRDEVPNVELGKQIAAKNDKVSVKELITNLDHKKKDVSNDCIKVLYEAGNLNPALLVPYTKEFLSLLDSKNNRMQWGAMTALSSIAAEDPKSLYKVLPKILDAANKGSVITKDHCYKIMCALCAEKALAMKVFPLMMEFLLKSPPNQLPAYAEATLPFVNEKNKAVLLKTLRKRLDDVETPSKKSRLDKVIRKLES